MFHPIEGGSVYVVPDNCFGFEYKCWLPPVGFGVNSITGELQETDIIKRSDIEEEQKWERFVLPKQWHDRRKIEKERQKFDRYYVDPYVEEIRAREWNRRLCGVWFWNYCPKKKKSVLTYITGNHYLYITYWKFQGRLMDFRINDMEFWYVMRYCETDPNCLGINEITKRKLGKTAKLGCWMYNRTSMPPTNQHCAFQSKADSDAEEVMKKAVVQPWQKLPDFFRPVYDLMKGDDPNELRFFHTSRRGSTAEVERDEEEALESWIEHGASGEGVFDGPELDSYGSDEAGKTKKPVSIKERQNTVRYCQEIDGEFKHRRCYYTTTVEIERGEEDNYEFLEMTVDSNPLVRNENGRTKTGLYTYFLPAQKGMYFDDYGFPDEERATKFLLKEMQGYIDSGDTRGLSSFKRKNPMDFKSAFAADGESALYDPELLNSQLDDLNWGEEQTEFGDLKWEEGESFFIEVETSSGEKEQKPNRLKWVPNPKGKYEKVKGWFPKEGNAVVLNNGVFSPNNNHSIRIGCDPFRYDKTKDKRRSNCAAFAYQLPDVADKGNEYEDMFTIRYCRRENSTRAANMDVLKMAWWCGCKVLFERNINHWKDHFREWKCSGFLMWLPGEVEPGIITAGDAVQDICDVTEAYINSSVKKVKFKTLIRKETGWLGFKVEDTQKFDEPMASGICLLARKVKSIRRAAENMNRVESVIPYRKAV
jgi:hypothetical protein